MNYLDNRVAVLERMFNVHKPPRKRNNNNTKPQTNQTNRNATSKKSYTKNSKHTNRETTSKNSYTKNTNKTIQPAKFKVGAWVKIINPLDQEQPQNPARMIETTPNSKSVYVEVLKILGEIGEVVKIRQIKRRSGTVEKVFHKYNVKIFNRDSTIQHIPEELLEVSHRPKSNCDKQIEDFNSYKKEFCRTQNKSSYRKMALLVHPDKATKECKHINFSQISQPDFCR